MQIPQLGIFFCLVILLSFSAFFSGSEAALFSLGTLTIKRLLEKKKPAAAQIFQLLENPRRTLITILFGNMLVNVLISTISATLLLRLFGRTGLELSIIGVTFFILIFGEILPKTLAIHHNEILAQFVARPIDFLAWLITPIRKILRLFTDIITYPVSNRFVSAKYSLAQEDLKTIISIGQEDGLVKEYQKQILEGLVDFGEKTVKELMIPRTEIFYVNLDDSFEQVLKKISAKNFSRVPVIEKTIDEIKGIVYTKELIKLKIASGEAQNSWQNLLKPAYFVPETKKTESLLKELIECGTHLALVLDEYGGISGLITLENLLEEIFGEASNFPQKPNVKFLVPGTALISGDLEIKKFNKIFGANLKDKFNETMAGFLATQMDRIPKPLEVFNTAGFSFLIIKATPKKISEIQVTKNKFQPKGFPR